MQEMFFQRQLIFMSLFCQQFVLVDVKMKVFVSPQIPVNVERAGQDQDVIVVCINTVFCQLTEHSQLSNKK
jgi:hypothetical protein